MSQIKETLQNFKLYIEPYTYFLIEDILTTTDYEFDLVVLLDQLDEYYGSLNEENDISAKDIEQNVIYIIKTYLIEEIIYPNYRIKLNLDSVSLNTLEGLMGFLSTLDIFNPIITPEVYNTLVNIELEDELKIGKIINLYNVNYNPIDAYDDIEYIATGAIDALTSIVENTMDRYEDNAEDISEWIDKLKTIDIKLVNCYLSIFIMNHTDTVTEESLISYLDYIVKTKELTVEQLSNELIVYALYFNKSYDEMVDLVTTLYNDYNTTILGERLHKVIGGKYDSE